MDEELIYLDHAATTPVDEAVLQSMMPYFQEKFFNPSSPYSRGVEVKRDYQLAKQRIAVCLGVKSDELVMTAGATESVNIALAESVEKIAIAEIEHASVISASKRRGEPVIIPVGKNGRISPEVVKQILTPDISLISIGLANSETGIIQPIAEIAQTVESERSRRRLAGETTPLYFHTDASQGALLIDIKLNRLGVDMLTLGASKVYGPKQVGLLWVKPGIQLSPLIVGGGQERGIRSGTENVAGVVGFATALELASKRRSGEVKRLRELRDEMEKRLSDEFPEMIVSSDKKRGLVSFLNVSFPGVDAERLIFWLEGHGVMVASGSACSARDDRSHVLKAIGLSDQEIDGSLRISLGRLSTRENCQKATDLIVQAVRLEKQRLQK